MVATPAQIKIQIRRRRRLLRARRLLRTHTLRLLRHPRRLRLSRRLPLYLLECALSIRHGGFQCGRLWCTGRLRSRKYLLHTRSVA